ncbi:PPOX class probable F420-dependent enzyme [Halolamina pelagica]|uniref:PPOX class probable F420-dependent enzyme n=1 Tax=Halolamina pelagica TaxID=699431 RepID=A0A0P7H807_9EURY|nr:PPOX class probable F420-dependent enzyme [Halolamina pelagica]
MIPESHVDIFESESFAHLATIMPNGMPHVTPVWVDHEDREYVLVNTARGRRKEKNVRREPMVGLSVYDPDDPYRYVSVQGRPNSPKPARKPTSTNSPSATSTSTSTRTTARSPARAC